MHEMHDLTGRYVVARCYYAGVHAGVLAAHDQQQVVLHQARRLWSWEANEGVALSGVARSGLKDGKIDTEVPEVWLGDCYELLQCSKEAEDSIRAA